MLQGAQRSERSAHFHASTGLAVASAGCKSVCTEVFDDAVVSEVTSTEEC